MRCQCLAVMPCLDAEIQMHAVLPSAGHLQGSLWPHMIMRFAWPQMAGRQTLHCFLEAHSCLVFMHLVQASCCWTRKYMGRLHSLRQSVCYVFCALRLKCSGFWVCRFCGDEKLPCNCGAPACRGFVNAAKRSMEGDGMLVLRSRLKPYTGQKLVWDGE